MHRSFEIRLKSTSRFLRGNLDRRGATREEQGDLYSQTRRIPGLVIQHTIYAFLPGHIILVSVVNYLEIVLIRTDSHIAFAIETKY